MCEYLVELDEFKEHFRELLVELCEDKVRNVRISIARMVRRVGENAELEEVRMKLRGDGSVSKVFD